MNCIVHLNVPLGASRALTLWSERGGYDDEINLRSVAEAVWTRRQLLAEVCCTQASPDFNQFPVDALHRRAARYLVPDLLKNR